MKRIFLHALALLLLFCQINGQNIPQLGNNKNAEVIAAMTLDEKARLLVGMGFAFPGFPPPEYVRVPGEAGSTASIPRLGIPSMALADGPAGLRISPTRPDDSKTYYATAFPTASLLAASWDPELVYQVGASMGNEVKEYGVDILLAPGMNIQRNALGGRNYEYYSEDPLLSGKIAASMVKGVQSNGVGVSVKHLVANNNETNRMTLDVKVSERALREIYLRGFEIAVKEGKPWTVMSSYNKVNGTYTSERRDLLTDMLRGEWGFKGFVMTDWFAMKDPVEQMRAGNNLIMPGDPGQVSAIIDAVKSGKLDEKVLDQNVDGMLNIIRESPTFKNYKASNQPDLKAHAEIARITAAEGMVLLKNQDQTLPIAAGRKIAAFGNHSYDLVSGGTGSGDVNEAYTISLIGGLENAGFSVDKALQTVYENYLREEKAKQPAERPFLMPVPIIPERMPDSLEIETSTAADFAIITIGRSSGEFVDRQKDDDFELTRTEQDLIKAVSGAFHAKGKKVAVVLNTGGVIETASWRDNVDAILLTWLPGQEAGNSIADILSGKVNPSGKLPTTFPKNYEDDPTSNGFPGKVTGDVIDLVFLKTYPAEIVYDEGIYVGYRAFDKRKIEPAYEFGYGLSYTNFEYSGLAFNKKKFKKEIIVSVTVKNTGTLAGKEITQLYLSAPAATLDKPVTELVGFAKTRLLQPGESQTFNIKLYPRTLASYDERSSSWIAEKGIYSVKSGASSRDIRLSADFKLDKTIGKK